MSTLVAVPRIPPAIIVDPVDSSRSANADALAEWLADVALDAATRLVVNADAA